MFTFGNSIFVKYDLLTEYLTLFWFVILVNEYKPEFQCKRSLKNAKFGQCLYWVAHLCYEQNRCAEWTVTPLLDHVKMFTTYYMQYSTFQYLIQYFNNFQSQILVWPSPGLHYLVSQGLTLICPGRHHGDCLCDLLIPIAIPPLPLKQNILDIPL